MHSNHPVPSGLWLPLITPFRDGVLDERSFRRLVKHYAAEPVDGFVLGATTGEGLTLDDQEVERLVAITAAEMARAMSASASDPDLSWTVPAATPERVSPNWRERPPGRSTGYLVTCPHYTRPSQQGLYRHFSTLADNARAANSSLQHSLSNRRQSQQRGDAAARRAVEHRWHEGLLRPIRFSPSNLMRSRPCAICGADRRGHAVLRRADQGADGGILAAAHVETAGYVWTMRDEACFAGDQPDASAAWIPGSSISPSTAHSSSHNPMRRIEHRLVAGPVESNKLG